MADISSHVPKVLRRVARRARYPRAVIAAAGITVLVALLPTAQPASAAPVRPAAPSALAAPQTVPGPPSGWSTVFSDDFAGASGSGIDSQWMYDTGPGSSFGTGEIET